MSPSNYNRKNSFIFYHEYKKHFELLSPDDLTALIFAIFDYEEEGIVRELSPMAAMAFSFIRTDLDNSRQKYFDQCQKNRDNANKRWHPKDATACDRMRSDANDADNDNDNDNDNENTLPGKGKKEMEKDFEISEFSKSIQDTFTLWIEYKKRKYTKIGFKSLKSQVKKAIGKYGEPVVSDRIEHAMAHEWVGMNLNTIEAPEAEPGEGERWQDRAHREMEGK